MGIESAKGGSYRYYNCLSYLRQGRSTCEGTRVPQGDLEHQILDHLAAKLFSKDRLKIILRQLSQELAKAKQRNDARYQEVRKRLASTQEKTKKHYEAIESGALDIDLVAERLRELKETQSLLQEQLERLETPKQLPPYLFKDESLARVQEGLKDIFLSGDPTLTRRYLRFLLDRIEVQGEEVRLHASKTALCNFALTRKTEGTVNHSGTVPSCGIAWLPICNTKYLSVG